MGSPQSFRKWVAQAPVWANGGNAVVPLADLPPGRVLGIGISLLFDVVQGAGAVAINGAQLFRLIDQVRIREYVRTTGRGLYFLRWHMTGYTPSLPAQVPAAAATYSRAVDYYIPFADPDCESPMDTAIDSRLLKDQPIEINWATVANLANANTSLANVTTRVIVYMDKPAPGDLPAEVEINYQDWNQQSILMPAPGGITHLLAYNETSDAMTDANFSTFTVYADGDILVPQMRTRELAAEFDFFQAIGGSVFTDSATLPVGGAVVNAEPGVAAAAGQGVTVPWIPILNTPHDYSLGHVPTIDDTLRVDFTGAATAIRLLSRRVKYTDKSRCEELARKLGFDNPAQRGLSVKVSGPGVVTGDIAKLLPKRIQTTAEERRSRGGAA